LISELYEALPPAAKLLRISGNTLASTSAHQCSSFSQPGPAPQRLLQPASRRQL
jgi:hypothetical protein